MILSIFYETQSNWDSNDRRPQPLSERGPSWGGGVLYYWISSAAGDETLKESLIMHKDLGDGIFPAGASAPMNRRFWILNSSHNFSDPPSRSRPSAFAPLPWFVPFSHTPRLDLEIGLRVVTFFCGALFSRKGGKSVKNIRKPRDTFASRRLTFIFSIGCERISRILKCYYANLLRIVFYH